MKFRYTSFSAAQLVIAGLVTAMLCSSCSTIRLKDRADKDQHLTAVDFQQLKGSYSNGVIDSMRHVSNVPLVQDLKNERLVPGQQYRVGLLPLDPKLLQLTLYRGDSLIGSSTIKGRFRHGYFRTRRKYMASFIAGPLLWVLAEDFQYIGLTNDNKLVVLDSGGSGLLLFLVLPVFAGGAGQSDIEYVRVP